MWHQLCQRCKCKYTASVDIRKCAITSYIVTHTESYASAVTQSARERRIALYKESHRSHGKLYEGEQEQCCSVPVEALPGGLRISQWHKLCWSRAGVTLAGTTGQPRRSKSFPGPTSNPYLPPAPAYLH